jgi:hypothetical protein
MGLFLVIEYPNAPAISIKTIANIRGSAHDGIFCGSADAGPGDGVLGFANGEPEAMAQAVIRRVKSSDGDVVVPLTMAHTSYCWFPAKPEGWTEFGFNFMYPFPHSAPFATVFRLPPPYDHAA